MAAGGLFYLGESDAAVQELLGSAVVQQTFIRMGNEQRVLIEELARSVVKKSVKKPRRREPVLERERTAARIRQRKDL